MIVNGRGSIAEVHYTGDEAAAEIKKLLEAVVENEDDFDRWDPLINRIRALEGGINRNSSPSAIEVLRNVFDCMLAKFPLFFGFWQQYADVEFTIGGTETAEMVYERGVACIPYSVDLWVNYCAFKMNTSHDVGIIRDLFERAAHFVGLDYQSHPFWDKYIEFEERNNDQAKIANILSRAAQVPHSQYSRFYDKFRALLIGTQPVEDLADAETLATLQAAVDAENQGFERAPLEIERQLRTKLDHWYYEIVKRNAEEVTARWPFEEKMKRGYFHVTDIDEAELENWRKYLDWEEAQGDFARTVFLYERCLVACALYEEFWLRYARWMFSQGKDEDCRLIYARASCIFVPICQPTVRLNWARFEEKLGRTSIAHDIHESILEQNPDHVETIISLANVDRRHHGADAAVATLDKYIALRNVQIGGVLAAEQARILWQSKGSVDEARQLFKEKSDRFLDSREFWLKYMDFEIAQLGGDDEEHDSAVKENEARSKRYKEAKESADRAVANGEEDTPMPQEDDQLPVPEGTSQRSRVKRVHEAIRTKGRFSDADAKALSHHYMEFLMDHGGEGAADEFMKLDREVNGAYAAKPTARPAEPSSVRGSAAGRASNATASPSAQRRRQRPGPEE